MELRYFDAHTHPQFVAYDADREEIISRALDAGVGMNVVGTQQSTSAAAVKLAEAHDGLYASIGLHPIHTSKSYHDAKELGPSFAPPSHKATGGHSKASEGKGGAEGFTSRGEKFDAAFYRKLGKNAKVIAIGECGLDYYRVDESTKDIQNKAFVGQIELANELNKPLMLHIRNAYDDAIALIKQYAKVTGDVHFFAGDWNIAKQFIELGFTLSFTGVITFTHDYDEVVKNAPLNMLLSETDAPYITPVPFRGKRNESMHIPLVVGQIAAIRGEPLEKVRAQLYENARRVFGIS